MKFEIENGRFVGTAEWQAPGQVALDMKDDEHRTWFERFFAQETSSMAGPMDAFEMTHERRDSSQEAFQRAAQELAARAYSVRRANDERSTRSVREGRTDYQVRAMGDGRRHDSH